MPAHGSRVKFGGLVPGGADRIQFRRYVPDPSIEGRLLSDLAAERGQDPESEPLRADAERRVKLLLILQAIAKAEGIEVDDRDVDDRISQMAADSRCSPQALRTELEQKNGLERLALFLLAEQTMDYILGGEWQVGSGK